LDTPDRAQPGITRSLRALYPLAQAVARLGAQAGEARLRALVASAGVARAAETFFNPILEGRP
jgi:hypothetical protein